MHNSAPASNAACAHEHLISCGCLLWGSCVLLCVTAASMGHLQNEQCAASAAQVFIGLVSF